MLESALCIVTVNDDVPATSVYRSVIDKILVARAADANGVRTTGTDRTEINHTATVGGNRLRASVTSVNNGCHYADCWLTVGVAPYPQWQR